MNIWDFWARRYNRLWVQKYSLRPTRNYIMKELSLKEDVKILDLACGPGELIQEILRVKPEADILGLDSSGEMIKESQDKNPRARHKLMDVDDLESLDEVFDIIICTHAFPSFKNPDQVLKKLDVILADDGSILMAFASENNLYDKLALFFVKFTTGSANYLSDEKFRDLMESYFFLEKRKVIKERFFMPTIAIYRLKKVKK